jgi:flagellar hook-associated protein 1 FlgK
MSGIMNIGVRALQVNQSALQVIGNNIANVNTPGYSRQTVVLQNVPGQFTGSGYFGKGVDLQTVTRNYNEFLTKQSALAKSVASSDSARFDSLRQLENIFQGGPDGLGAAVGNMLNAFSDIVSAPTDLTARSVVLTRADEAANRFQAVASQLNDLRIGTANQLQTDVNAINDLANQIARANEEVTRALGSGHDPNDLLDQRDQLISQLNKYMQTTNIKADDGSVGIFLAGSQPLVLGTTVSPLTLDATKIAPGYNDPASTRLGITVGGLTHAIDTNLLGGGELSGLLRFKNQDLVDAGNLLGRMALAIGTKMNDQQALGLDLNGNPGNPMFNMAAIPNGYPSVSNTGNASITIGIQTNPSGTSAFVASDYEMVFTSPTTATVTRVADGQTTNVDFTLTNPAKIDGLDFTNAAGAAAAGDRFLLKPFSAAAGSITTAFVSPKDLAMASPVMASPAASNTGTVSIASLLPQQTNANLTQPVTLTFNGNGTFNVTGTGTGNPVNVPYVQGQAISYNGWSLTLKGAPAAGDTIQIGATPPSFVPLDAGNAQAMLALRDTATFDGGPLGDGYASLISDIGIRVQSAKSASTVSADIATNLEKDRAGISGVNLDEEAAKMLQFQQAYQAAGKMLQIAQNMFDTLMQNLSR